MEQLLSYPMSTLLQKLSWMGFFKQAGNDIISLRSAPPCTTKIQFESGYPTRNALLKIEDTIKILEPLPPQVPLTDILALPRVKEVLMVSPLMRVEEKIKTNKNIHYPPTSPPQFPFTSFAIRYKSSASNTVYVITQQPIENLKKT